MELMSEVRRAKSYDSVQFSQPGGRNVDNHEEMQDRFAYEEVPIIEVGEMDSPS